MTSIPIYFITNRSLVNEEKYFQVIKKVSSYPNIRIILREKDLSDKEYEDLYYKVKELAPNLDQSKTLIVRSYTNKKKIKEDVLELLKSKSLELNNN